ncbi:hypothetical protein SEA_BEUFFERT_143 [Streptomyces phage Beuffert]|nr:hypothetical protein SEA_BEUFFERT_143 [Streptomyces phage Beuffert]
MRDLNDYEDFLVYNAGSIPPNYIVAGYPRKFMDESREGKETIRDGFGSKMLAEAWLRVHLENYVRENMVGLWNPDHDQQAKCKCTHPYERHFDSYEDMYPIGCKYCECDTFNGA